jgi:hypothetical protein
VIFKGIPFLVPEIDPRSRDILNLRPNIQFVAPEIIEGVVDVVDAVVADAALSNMRKARDLAENVNKLALAAQVKVDTRADFTAKLDPNVDAHIVMAMRRKYPLDDPTEIRYDQYKKCKINVTSKGVDLAESVMVTPDKVVAAAETPLESVAFANSEDSKAGLNRPETQETSQVVEPIDMGSLQDKLIKALSNLIWKKAIKPVVSNSAPPVSFIFKALPDKIFPDDTLNIGSAIAPPFTDADISFSPPVSPPLTQGADPEAEAPGLDDLAADNQAENPLAFNDCVMVTKAYEKSAMFATSEEAVFAMLTPHLQTMIVQTDSAVKQIDSAEAITSVKGIQEQIQNEVAAAQSDASALQAAAAPPGAPPDGPVPPPAATTSNIVGDQSAAPGEPQDQLFTDFVPVSPEGERQWDRIFDSKCIPCGFRFSLDTQALAGFAGLGDALWNAMLGWFLQMKKYIDDILNFFSTLGGGNELCSFISFFCEFVCIPDIMKILALLSALLLKLSMEFTTLFDLILGLIAPLITPILSALISVLHQVIMMIIDPIKCIIDAIVAMMRKLDYNVIFQTAGAFNAHFSAGPLEGGTEVPNETRPVIPFTDVSVGAPTVRTGDTSRPVDFEFNPLGILADVQAEENAALDKARQELDAVQQAGASVDVTDPAAVEQHQQNLQAAQDNYANAADEANNSEIGEAANAVESLKPMLDQLVGYLEEIMAAVATFEAKLFDELQKLMGQYLGGTGSALHTNFKKLGIIQMISVITGLLQLLQGIPGCSCNDPNAVEQVASQLATDALTFWTDDEGVVHIEENAETTEAAIDDIIAILGGSDPGKTVLKSTGDPLLDTEIAKTVEALTTPVSISLRCSKQTSVADAEQVNQWIAELDEQE